MPSADIVWVRATSAKRPDIRLSGPTWLLSVVLSILVGCAAKPVLVSEWSNPTYRSRPLKKIVVAMTAGQPAVQRSFEDRLSAALNARGIDAIPSYRVVGDQAKLDEAAMRQAAGKVGADALMLTRLLGVDRRIEYSPLYLSPSVGFYGQHASMWYSWYGTPAASRYSVFISETTVRDIKADEIAWTGTFHTREPDKVETAIRNYIERLLTALADSGIIPPAG